MTHDGPRALVLDIERAQGWALVPFWDLSDFKNRRIHAKYVQEWPRTICLAWKWLGESDIGFSAEWVDREDMLATAWQLYDEADIVVGHNIDSFDTKKLAGEWVELGYDSPSPWKSVDTLKVARSRFGFESNTLDSLAKRLGLEGKSDHYDPEVAALALAGDVEAQERLESYNKGDVEQTELVYLRLRGWAKSHPNVSLYSDESRPRCPSCGSGHLQSRGYRTTNTRRYRQFQCQGCGGWSSSGVSEGAVDLRSVS